MKSLSLINMIEETDGMVRHDYLKIALALVALGPCVAFAETPNVNVYGTLNVDMESAKATGANNGADYPNRFRLSSNSSNFGVKGIEDINSSLKGVFQIEVSVNLASGALTNTANNSVIALRNSMLGLSGNFGTVSYGIWDTPFKVLTVNVDPYWGTGVGYMASIADSVGYGATSTTMATEGTSVGERSSFDRRQGNNVQYWSPTIYNTTARFMYSADVDRAGANSTAGNPDLMSASLTYDDGTVLAGFSWEQHDDYFTTTGNAAPVTNVVGSSSKDSAYKLAARYKFPFGLSLGGYWDRLKYQQTTAAGNSSYARGSITVIAMQTIDAVTIRAGYAHAADGTCDLASGATCDVKGFGATQGTLGASYKLSSRTDVYGLFSKIWNGNSNYNFIINGVNGTLPTGADPQAFGLGIRHTF
jgi:predicted porin